MDTGSDDLNLAAMMGAIVFGICVLLGIPWLAFREARRIRNSRVAVFRGKKLIELGVMMYLVWCLAACGVVLIPLMFIAPRRTMLALVDLFRGKQLGSIIDKWRI